MSQIINPYRFSSGGEGAPAPDYIAATGGTISEDGDYKVHVFNSSGTFTVTDEGGAGSSTVELLVVAGGGSSGSADGSSHYSGGGGAGG